MAALPFAMLLRLFLPILMLGVTPQCRNGFPDPGVAPITDSRATTIGDDAHADLRVFFVGNSLTYTNDLPAMVVELAAMDGLKMSATTLAFPNYALEDHLFDGELQKKLSKSKFDFVIAQQGPSALPESQVMLREGALRMAQVCEANGAKFALYGVWPSLDRSFDLDNCIGSYANAASACKALLCPAGLAWKLAWQKKPSLPLYGPDNFHPSVHGSALAALVIYASIRGKNDWKFFDPTLASWSGQVNAGDLEIMKEAAMQAVVH